MALQVDNGIEPIIYELHRIPISGTIGTNGHVNVCGGAAWGNRDSRTPHRTITHVNKIKATFVMMVWLSISLLL
jgi:hypothetical protein